MYLWKLDREKEQTLRRLRTSEAKLGQKRHQLESHILELEERCQGSAQKLLQVRLEGGKVGRVKATCLVPLSLSLHPSFRRRKVGCTCSCSPQFPLVGQEVTP